MTTDTLIYNVVSRFEARSESYAHLAEAIHSLTAAEEQANVAARDQAKVAQRGGEFAVEIGALRTLASVTQTRVLDECFELARQIGWLLATYRLAPVARESGEQAVTFVTSNSYMPPLRDIPEAEAVWQSTANDGGDVFNTLAEAMEERLRELNVYLDAPEYDNALYVVDLARFEHVDEPTGDDLGDEWKAIER